jgi:hypothetical protein
MALITSKFLREPNHSSDIDHFFTHLNDVPPTYSGSAGDFVAVKSGEDGLDFVTVSGIEDTKVFSFALRDNSADFFQVSSTTWTVAATFPFPGTDVVVPTVFSIVGSRDGTTDLAECRLYDATNTNEICYLSWSADVKAIYSNTSLANIPTSEAMFEVQIKKSSNPASKSRIHSAILR